MESIRWCRGDLHVRFVQAVVRVLGFVLAISFLAHAGGNGEVHLKVILVGPNLELRPVPKQGFEISRPGSPSEAVETVSTSFDGEAKFSLPPGAYVIRATKPVTLEGRSFNWQIPFDVKAGQELALELSNDNASTTGGATAAERVFQAVKEGVVTLESETTNGSAFLVDPSGLLLTNDHVVAGSRFLVVRLTAEERYPASYVFSDEIEDVAVIQVNPEVARSMSSLDLAVDTPEKPAVRIGEQVFAVGSPLDQEKIITTGIVGGLETGAIISDAMIDHGNSGGPLLNADGKVVGINTFGQGRGVSGTVRVWKAFSVLEEGKKRSSSMSVPSANKLPPYPNTRYPPDALKKIALSADFDPDDYRVRTTPFEVFFLTPPAGIYYELRDQIDASKGRKRRREFKKVQTDDTYDPAEGIRGWREYTGDYKPLVTIRVEPRIRATVGSSIAAGLLGVRSLTRYKYAGDFDTICLRRAGQDVPCIRVSRTPEKTLFSIDAGHMKDVAYVGMAEYLPEAFAPPAPGENLVLEITNEANPDKTVKVTLPDKLLKRIWDDFSPLRVPAATTEQ